MGCVALFSFIGADPASEWLSDYAVLDNHGFGQPDYQVPAFFTEGCGGARTREDAPNFSAWTIARWVKSSPAIPIGNPR